MSGGRIASVQTAGSIAFRQKVEPIEMIRGPGGTVWDANAVNGVIKIITANPGTPKACMSTGAVAGLRPAGFLRFGC